MNMKNTFADILGSFFGDLMKKRYILREEYEPYASRIIERLVWHKSLSMASALCCMSNRHEDKGELEHSLHRHSMDQIANEESYYFKVIQVYRLFKEKDIPFFPLKGPFWASMLYPDPKWRHFGDLDLFIPYHNAGKVFDVLSTLRFRPVTEPGTNRYNMEDHLKRRGELAFSIKNDLKEFTVEIHGTLITSTRYRRSYTIDEPLFWEGERTHAWRKMKFRVPPLEEWFLYLVMHGACQHQFKRFLSILDISHFWDLYQDALDWEKVIVRARQWRVEKALYYSLRVVNWFRDPSSQIQIDLKASSPFVDLKTAFLTKEAILFATERSGRFRRKWFRVGIT